MDCEYVIWDIVFVKLTHLQTLCDCVSAWWWSLFVGRKSEFLRLFKNPVPNCIMGGRHGGLRVQMIVCLITSGIARSCLMFLGYCVGIVVGFHLAYRSSRSMMFVRR